MIHPEDEDIAELMVRNLGRERVLGDETSRRRYRRDAWVLSELDDLEEVAVPLPSCVVRPTSQAEVTTVVNLCRRLRAPLIPAGLRSGVCGGVLAAPGSVVLDLSSLARIRYIDEHDLIGCFEAGVRGSDAEAALARHGLTLGHYPQSIDRSSVGGWVATRASGQFSTAYGSIENLVLGMEAVLPDGSVFEHGNAPRASTGPDLRHLLLGSEGTLGVITSVNLSLRRLPETRACRAYHVPSMRQGMLLQRTLLQQGCRPPVLRLYDSTEVRRLFDSYRRNDDCLLLVIHEGPRDMVAAERRRTARTAHSVGGVPAPAEAAEQWLRHRNEVPELRSFLEEGVIVDTIEVAVRYSEAAELYRDCIAAICAVDGALLGSAHSSHAYQSGICLYFTFAARPPRRADLRRTYQQCWHAVLSATQRAGGTISHHHGIGRVRRHWLETELGRGRLQMLRQIKHALDPHGFMNPGALIPG